MKKEVNSIIVRRIHLKEESKDIPLKELSLSDIDTRFFSEESLKKFEMVLFQDETDNRFLANRKQ